MTNQKNRINKIFAIGLGHTGTRSLDKALHILGIKSTHWPTDKKTYNELLRGNYKLSILKEYDAITDITTVEFYPQLDKAYPGSKFVLTVRDKEPWLASMNKINNDWLKYFGQIIPLNWQKFKKEVTAYGGVIRFLRNIIYRTKMINFQRITTYGALAFEDKDRRSDVYDAHHKNVFDYFKDRPNDLLVMNVCNGDGWDLLCKFLSRPTPDIPFPHVRPKK